ncbi:CrcB family protein [Rhodococcus sp. P1Y]|uniref:CrcB family protein n=1 Tax=Rhodococcus sp. P1Y TaxID=1302308 RepID=UPI000EAEF4C8|nr:CrcB family protein [Rhodococcus sp. P1Y]AYJ48158.1 hypothetical protein D8W71_07205 [Rhodococcus sp. P1Y]
MTVLILIALGGAAGALVHHHLTRADPKRVLVLTVVTCAVLGFVTAAAPPQWLAAVVSFGFLAALAPMSSIALVTVLEFRARRYRSGALFLVASIVGGIACAMFGFLLYSSGMTLYRKF